MPARPAHSNSHSPSLFVATASLIAPHDTPPADYNDHTIELVQYILDWNILFSGNNSDTQAQLLTHYITNYFNQHGLTLPILHKIALALSPYIKQAKKLNGNQYHLQDRTRALYILNTAVHDSWLELFPNLLVAYTEEAGQSGGHLSPLSTSTTPPPNVTAVADHHSGTPPQLTAAAQAAPAPEGLSMLTM